MCIGGGLLGLETAAALACHGAEVTVLEDQRWLLPRQLNSRAGGILHRYVADAGIKLRTHVATREIIGDRLVQGVLLADGSLIAADLVVMATGIRSNSHLARRAGLEVNQGVVVNDLLAASHPDVFAAGDVAEHHGRVYGIWGPAQYQGSIAGLNMAGGSVEFGGVPCSNTLKVLGVDVFSIGQIHAEDPGFRVIDEESDGRYFRFVFRDHRLVGAVLLGDAALTAAVTKAVEENRGFRDSWQSVHGRRSSSRSSQRRRDDGIMNTPENDFPDPAIQAKLAGIAKALPSPPEWFDDWNRLGPESSAEEILAVCRRIRDSGCLPADAGLHLMAGQIDAMIGDEANTSLRGLDDRMKAMERAYEQETGRPWPFDDIPPEYREYEELLRQYEAAWDKIFAGRLEACGEREMAALYRADPKEFERRYEAGWNFFQQEEPQRQAKMASRACPDLVEGRRPRSPDNLVQIASCLDVSRAELVRMTSAGAGIAAALGNATFVSWYWHYSNAVGGVKVYVCNRDFDRAREVLDGGLRRAHREPAALGVSGLRSAGGGTMGRVLAMRPLGRGRFGRAAGRGRGRAAGRRGRNGDRRRFLQDSSPPAALVIVAFLVTYGLGAILVIRAPCHRHPLGDAANQPSAVLAGGAASRGGVERFAIPQLLQNTQRSRQGDGPTGLESRHVRDSLLSPAWLILGAIVVEVGQMGNAP